MELLYTISSNHLLSPTVATIFPPKYSFTAWRKKTPSRLSIHNSKKFPLHPPVSHYLPLSSPSRLKLSAHFRRSSNRQNYLRKKLTPQKEVSLNSDSQNPVIKFINNDSSASNLDNLSEESNSLDVNSGAEVESKSKRLGGNVLWDKLENWVEQYKKDAEFWGIGTGPIFTVFQDSKGKVERVVVNEDEIFRRCGVEPLLIKDEDFEGLTEVNERISHAKALAGEMENGNVVLPGNSSVVKLVTSEGNSVLVNMIQGVNLQPGLHANLSRVGLTVACGVFVILAVKQFFAVGESKQEETRLEKEMIRRKVKARREKEKTRKGTVEVIQDSEGPMISSVERPQLDKQELMNIITEAGESSSSTLVLPKYSGSQDAMSVEFDHKVQEIRKMARQVRELEKRSSLTNKNDGEDHETLNELSREEEMSQKHKFVDERSQTDHPDGHEGQTSNHGGTPKHTWSTHDSTNESGFLIDVTSTEDGWTQSREIINTKIPDDSDRTSRVMDNTKLDLYSFDPVQVNDQSENSSNHLCKPSESSATKKFRIIQSVKEAREYLSKKPDNIEFTLEHGVRSTEQVHRTSTKRDRKEAVEETSQILDTSDRESDPSILTKKPDFICVSEKSSSSRHPKTVERKGEQKDDLGTFRLSETESSHAKLSKEKETDIEMSQEQNNDSKIFPLCVTVEPSDSPITCGDSMLGKSQNIPAKENVADDILEGKRPVDLQLLGSPSDQETRDQKAELASSVNERNWMEKNFHEFEPIVRKIGVGFRDNYMVAKAKTNQDINSNTDMSQLMPEEDGNELEWMKDERLREIVFTVRENELAGRDPFYLMNEEDKLAFFTGLEKKAEQENAKLMAVHEWVHSNIENLDYGSDGISLYDPPEKIIPRWKGPPVDKIPEFLENSIAQQKEFLAENVRDSNLMEQNGKDSLKRSKESLSRYGLLIASALSDQNTNSQNKSSKTARTVVEGSDGSLRAGKKLGKEYWQHTKKWSQGFLESYNAETDAEIKAIMKDMGKDLDRWITEKEIKEAADLMDKLPERGQELIKGKVNKVKREMEMFGPQAVVSKYREFADEKEEDYLWWLDLPYVLCIELYTQQEGEQKVGFYSLEMAADLELDPKQYHVLAFQDAGDCKNMCYIIQAHMEMLGQGNAFVAARLPKDAFREAKTNGFGVTVIRKGELQLNVDQTLEEVEELIAEIGSKIYHDTIMRERSVDISALMNGVFGLKKPGKRRRLKRKLKKPAKS